VCGAERNHTGYCSPEVDKLVDQQSMEPNQEKRNTLVWEIEKRLAEDGAQPVIFFPRGGTFRQPWVKGLALILEEWRTEWLAARF
jgi:peptide/nickel transport system substrate-binding protein